MSQKSSVSSMYLVVFIALVSWLAYSGLFYQTGKQWFDSCWQAQNSKEGPKTPDEAASRGKCKYIAEKSLFESGFIFSGNPEHAVTPELKEIVAACPSNYSDIPFGGPQILAVDMVESHGGAEILDSFLPASHLIVGAFKSRWPNCPSARERGGFPKIVERNGVFEWEAPCKPCEAEQTAINKN